VIGAILFAYKVSSMSNEPLFEEEIPIHVFKCGCVVTDASDEGRDGLPELYVVLCEEHKDPSPERYRKSEERSERRS